MFLPLPLLVARIRCADHADHPVTANDLAVLADLLDRRTNFHKLTTRTRPYSHALRATFLRVETTRSMQRRFAPV
jgi:hypothetical protein